MRRKKKLIAFTLYPDVTPLDLIGPLTVLRNLAFGSRYRAVVVGQSIQQVDTDTPLRMVPAQTFAEVPDPFAVIVPGGGAGTIQAMANKPLLDYVRSTTRTAEIVGSTGTGSLIIAAAGVLKGRRAATHWAYRKDLENLGATYAPERWIDDGRFLTSAAGSAGIDMALNLLARLTSQSAAKLAQLFMEYDPQPPFGGINWSNIEGNLASILRTPRDTRTGLREKKGTSMSADSHGAKTIAMVLLSGDDDTRPDRPAPGTCRS